MLQHRVLLGYREIVCEGLLAPDGEIVRKPDAVRVYLLPQVVDRMSETDIVYWRVGVQDVDNPDIALPTGAEAVLSFSACHLHNPLEVAEAEQDECVEVKEHAVRTLWTANPLARAKHSSLNRMNQLLVFRAVRTRDNTKAEDILKVCADGRDKVTVYEDERGNC